MNWLDTATGILASALSAATPLLLAAAGGLFTELAGMLNIALEGLILAGAFFGFAAASATGSIGLGILAGALASSAIAWIYGSATLKLKANVFITGLAANIFAPSITAVLSASWFGTRSVVALPIPEPARIFQTSLGRLPLLGEIFFSHHSLTYLSWVLAAGAALLLYRSVLGTRIRATGARAEAVAAAGFRPDSYKLAAIVLSGFFCGIAGASLSLPLGAFVPNMSSGRGWIALVAIYLGNRRPGRTVLACLVFALAESFSNYAQGQFGIPSEFILAIPFAATLVALSLGTSAQLE
ncbi:MAG: ABC transporter permease [Spirochaetia bacterium]|jgi:simple sugar transport system permease protein|nr:ABC transporter permease [Spirochaetia bacterium]